MATDYKLFMVLPGIDCFVLPPTGREWFPFTTSKKNVFCETQEMKNGSFNDEYVVYNQLHWLIAVKKVDVLPFVLDSEMKKVA